MTDLLSGRYPVEAYALLVAQHRAIYAALESAAARWVDHPAAGAFVLPHLHRSSALRHDLAALYGPGWSTLSARAVLPATHRYVTHLRTVAASRPEAFVAHHYVRYLGDLSGGQIVRRGLREIFGPAVAAATSFYDFDGVPAVKPFRDSYRAALDALALDPPGADALVAEAVCAFEHNHAVLLDLGARCEARSGAR